MSGFETWKQPLKRCKWCGQFVESGTAPTPGFNIELELIEQTLCPTHERDWKELSNRNQAWNKAFARKTYGSQS